MSSFSATAPCIALSRTIVLTTITGALTCRSTRMHRTPDEFAEGEVVEVREVGGLHHHGERRPRNIIDHNAVPESITSVPR